MVDGVVYVGDISGILYAFDAESGEELWRYEDAEGGIYGSVLVVDGVIYFGTEAGNFYALTTDQDFLWPASISGKIYGAPAISGDLIVVSAIEGEALVTAIDTDGVARWTFTPEN